MVGKIKIDPGFTIVELLIVIVVIGVLAAITLVAYGSIQGRAYDSTVQSNLKNIGSQILQYSVENGTLPATSGELTSLGMKVSGSAYGNHFFANSSDYNMAYCRFSSTNRFAVVAASRSGNVYVVTDGTVRSGVGPMQTIATTCANNGFSGAATTWFLSMSVWQFGISS